MSIIIRDIKSQDFFKISELFEYKKSIEELKWLFRDIYNIAKFNANVAVDDDGNIIGLIGYVESIYRQGDKEVKGVFPMSWKIKNDHKGFAGVLLMKSVLSKGDFGVAVGGTKKALKLYSLFKLDYIRRGIKFYKIISLRKFFLSLEENMLRKIAKTILLLPGYLKRIGKKSIYNDIDIIKYDRENFFESINVNKAFSKQITKNYIDWLLDCPNLKTYAFYVKKADEILGICIFYIREVNRIKRGRIVYMPYLGSDKKLWKSVLYKSFEFFKSKGCCSVSSFATNKSSQKGYSIGMFRFVRSQPIYIKDTKQILKNFDLRDWDMQFTEGDLAYLNV